MCYFEIKDLRDRDLRILRNEIPNSPGVYKWWCCEELLKTILKGLDLDFAECKKHIENIPNLVILKVDKNSIVHKHINNDVFYCVYVGDTAQLRRRIISNHIVGNIRGSTLRKTICAVLVGCVNEDMVNKIQDDMIIEITEFSEEKFHDEQSISINQYFRPLNNDDILPSNLLYSEKRHYFLRRNGKSRASNRITELRKKL